MASSTDEGGEIYTDDDLSAAASDAVPRVIPDPETSVSLLGPTAATPEKDDTIMCSASQVISPLGSFTGDDAATPKSNINSSFVSAASAESAGATSLQSRKDAIRARMRNQEQRFSEMLNHTTLANIIGKAPAVEELKDVKETLDQVEAEKKELERKLQYLQQRQAEEEAKNLENDAMNAAKKVNMDDIKVSDEHDAFLREKMSSIQLGFQEQAAKINALEDDLISKNAEIDRLMLEMSNKLKYIVELEFNLQSHEIHYTEYAEQQYKLGDDAITEIRELLALEAEMQQGKQNDQTNNEDGASNSGPITPKSDEHASGPNSQKSVTSVGSTTSLKSPGDTKRRGLHPRRAQALIAKLLKDLDHLEEMYKQEKLKSMKIKQELESENEDLKAQVRVHEQKSGATAQGDDKKGKHNAINAESSSDMNIENLKKKVEKLEAIRFLQRKEILHLEEEMGNIRKEAEEESRKQEVEMKRLTLQLEALRVRCDALETEVLDVGNQSTDDDSSFGVGEHISKAQKQSLAADASYRVLENRFYDCLEEIGKLEADLDIKDRQIATLRKELYHIRVREIEGGGNVEGKNFSRSDAKIVSEVEKKAHIMRTLVRADHSPDSTDRTAESFSSETEEVSQHFAQASADFVADLQKKLKEANELLAAKNQELAIEKAKSSCMAANLLNRIDALDKHEEEEEEEESKAEASSPTKKAKKKRKRIFGKVPLRFYL